MERKHFKTFMLLFNILLIQYQIVAQAKNENVWNGKECTVVLTYDDGLNVHLDNVVPYLNEAGIKGTFYVPGKCETMSNRLNEWRLVSESGHELGNHTLFHPCDGSLPNRDWVSKDYDLSKYSLNRITDEIQLANTLLHAVDGKNKRTFAYTCGDIRAGNESFVDYIKSDFIAARNVKRGFNFWGDVDLYQINCFGINDRTGQELIDIVEKGKKQKALIVFLFHGVGGEHSLNVSLEAHSELIDYLKEHENEILTTTMANVASLIKNSRIKND